MLLDNSEQILDIATRAHFSIFDFPGDTPYPKLPKTIPILANDKNHIPIEQIRQIEILVRTKQSSDLNILIHDAEKLTESAANAFLKLLEEPGEHIHFIFFTTNLFSLLPTIRSRAHIYFIKDQNTIDAAPIVDAAIISLAKEYISATSQQLLSLSQALAKDRAKALLVVETAIQLLYKSYFKTGNQKFLEKLFFLLKTFNALQQNGHVRLQLVANML